MIPWKTLAGKVHKAHLREVETWENPYKQWRMLKHRPRQRTVGTQTTSMWLAESTQDPTPGRDKCTPSFTTHWIFLKMTPRMAHKVLTALILKRLETFIIVWTQWNLVGISQQRHWKICKCWVLTSPLLEEKSQQKFRKCSEVNVNEEKWAKFATKQCRALCSCVRNRRVKAEQSVTGFYRNTRKMNPVS